MSVCPGPRSSIGGTDAADEAPLFWVESPYLPWTVLLRISVGAIECRWDVHRGAPHGHPRRVSVKKPLLLSYFLPPTGVPARGLRPPGLKVSYLVDSASSHMLVSKIKPCMSKYKQSIR